MTFLETLASFAERITSKSAKGHVRCLTRDTGTSLRNTCRGLCAAAKHLFESNFGFVIFELFSTDPLERFFGKCRQAAGSNYFITVRNIIEKHRFDKARILAKLHAEALSSATSCAEVHECDACRTLDYKLLDILPLLACEIPTDVKETVVYVAGYVARECFSDDDNVVDTFEEYRQHRRFFLNVNRGGLSVPWDSLVFLLYYVYIVLVTLFERNQIPCYRTIQLYCEHICSLHDLVADNRKSSVFRVVANIALNNLTQSFESPAASGPARKVAKLSSD